MDAFSYNLGSSGRRQAEQDLMNERSWRTANRASIAGLLAVLRHIERRSPELVQNAMREAFIPAYEARATELGYAKLNKQGASGIKTAAKNDYHVMLDALVK